MGEENESRRWQGGVRSIEKLKCHSSEGHFLLYKLNYVSGVHRIIDRKDDRRGLFEALYTVDYLLFFKTPLRFQEGVSAISVVSSKIASWIGHTLTQNEILKRNTGSIQDRVSPNELTVELESSQNFGVFYNLSTLYSPLDFESGIKFPPAIDVFSEKPLPVDGVKEEFEKLYNLLSFLFGGDFAVDRIGLERSISSRDTGSLYFPTAKLDLGPQHRLILFPLGKDLVFNTLGLPSLSPALIQRYYSLDDFSKSFFFKYLRYKRISNVEEKFLGFFRLLETLCHKKKSFLNEEKLEKLIERATPYFEKVFNDKKNVKSFLKGIPRYNGSKYNTEKCIGDFYDSFSEHISSRWVFKKSDIKLICRLRNDITHANEYFVSDEELLRKSKFIEVVLVIAMFNKLLDVGFETVSKVINRLDGYHLIIEQA